MSTIDEDLEKAQKVATLFEGEPPWTKYMSQKKRPKVLFITEAWPRNNPNYGLTNSYHNLFGSLESTGLADYELIHPDFWYLEHNEPLDAELLTTIAQKHGRPDAIFYTWLTNKNGELDFLGPFNPKLNTWRRVKLLAPKLPICGIWWDSAWEASIMVMNSLRPYFDLNLTIDVTFPEPTKDMMAMWTPQDPRLYYGDPLSARLIQVSHAGRLDNRPERVEGFEELYKLGITVHHTGGQMEQKLAPDDYAGYFRASQISLDFTPLLHKGRLFEVTMCGSCLFAAETSQARLWFKPMEEYVTYKMKGQKPDYGDLAQKINYYLEHNEERLAIASAGHKKATEEYCAHKWWNKVLRRLEVI